MVFSSISFLFFFLPVTMVLYYIAPRKWQNILLCINGLLFYAWGEPVFVLFMILCILLNFGAGLLMEKFDGDDKKRKAVMIASVVFSLGLLGVCKYSGFVADTVGLSIKTLPLPIGISFYTFQSMSYTIDLYRRNIKVQKSVFNFGAYVAMFPQIIAGPIVRYADVEKELENREVTLSGIGAGAGIFICGLAKKSILANSIGQLWTAVKATEFSELSVLGAWIGILAFTFQIYFDFSGYSDMAVGLGRMLGFHFPENFRYPYTARSVSDFWRRWHMTLGTWFREYVYIPLGGNRVSTIKNIRNLLVVWGLTGLWHGASWNFILWGLYFGILQILEKFCFKKLLERLPAWLTTATTFLLVVFSWVLFDIEAISDVGRFFGVMFGTTGVLYNDIAVYQLINYAVVFVVCILASLQIAPTLRGYCTAKKERAKLYYSVLPVAQLALFLLCVAFLVNETYNPFLYFRF